MPVSRLEVQIQISTFYLSRYLVLSDLNFPYPVNLFPKISYIPFILIIRNHLLTPPFLLVNSYFTLWFYLPLLILMLMGFFAKRPSIIYFYISYYWIYITFHLFYSYIIIVFSINLSLSSYLYFNVAFIISYYLLFTIISSPFLELTLQH